MTRQQKIDVLKALAQGNSAPLLSIPVESPIAIRHERDNAVSYSIGKKSYTESEFETFLKTCRAETIFILPNDYRQCTEN